MFVSLNYRQQCLPCLPIDDMKGELKNTPVDLCNRQNGSGVHLIFLGPAKQHGLRSISAYSRV